MENIIAHFGRILLQKDRFIYDLRSDCQVYTGIVCAYGATHGTERITEIPLVITHALAHDGVVGAWKNPADGVTFYDSCRLFTDIDTALRFARRQGQRSVYNLNRDEEVLVDAWKLRA